MWLLVVASCVAGDPAPECGGGTSPVFYPAFEACEDAAVHYHDQMRSIAEEAGITVLLLDTRCLPTHAEDPA